MRAASVNLAAESATVEVLAGAVEARDLVAAIRKAGYAAAPRDAGASAQDRKDNEVRALLLRVVVSAALTLPVFVVEMGGHLVPAFHHWFLDLVPVDLWRWIQFALTLVVLAGPGRMFFAKGIPSLLRGAPDMNALVALGAGAAFLYSTVVTVAPMLLPVQAQNVYFEASAVIVTLILLGRYLEARAKGRTGAALRKLAGLKATTARVERDGAGCRRSG